jgi:hypothetical protein
VAGTAGPASRPLGRQQVSGLEADSFLSGTFAAGATAKRGGGMRRIIAVEPGEWVILPCILETDDCYYRVDVYPDGRVEAADDERFAKSDYGGPDYKSFAAIYNSQNDYMMFLRRPIPLTPEGNMPVAGGSQLAAIAAQSMLLED